MRYVIALMLCVFSTNGFTQPISGYIFDNNRQPISGVTVANLRSAIHAHTNDAGFFVLKNTVAGDTLQLSHVGYQSRLLKFTSNLNTADIRLIDAATQLSDVVVNSGISASSIISRIDLKTNPVNSSQELLRKVPGLFIGQHAGGGKAEQIFLRGFDIDHGTDISIAVDGMPVNMVSHAHGQGYADLHFLIPELVENINFEKGPYDAVSGNLATTGYVGFNTKDRLDNSSITLEAGRFNTLRTLGMFNLVNTEQQSAYIATEHLSTDGPFISSQNFNRLNLTGKYSATLTDKSTVSLLVSYLNSKWDASGQIPERAVQSGQITRFGAIDNTEGGNTSRTNIIVQYNKFLPNNAFVKTNAFYSKNHFELFSNFTFFLNDPVNGDQIKQKENRSMAGFNSEYNQSFYKGLSTLHFKAGTGLRYDDANDTELSHTLNRKTVLQNVMLGDINETNLFAYSEMELHKGRWQVVPGVRLDYLKFDYVDKLVAAYKTQSQSKAIVSPKLNFYYAPGKDMQYFLKLGKGFHSNDTRVVVAQNGKEILPAAYGADLGLISKPFPKLVLNAALWYLYLQQEFVYVGDAGIVEPGGKTQRAGVDVGLRYQAGNHIFFHSDFTYTRARAINKAKGENYIPLAPKITLAGGVSFKTNEGFAGSLKTRYLGNRSANEDNSIVAKGYFVSDLNINYSRNKFTIGIISENVFATEWNETQFATESRLFNEPQSVTEIHFTPGTPFSARGFITYKF